MAKRKRSAFSANDLTIARTEGDVRYLPQIQQAHALLSDAATQKVSDINAAKQGAASTIAFARGAKPQTRQIFNRGQGVVGAAESDVSKAFGALGGAADPYRAIQSREAAGATSRIEEAKAAALNDLTQQALGAKAGRGLAINQANTSYNTSKTKIGQQLSDLLGQRGEYIAGQLGTLANARAERGAKVTVAKIGAKARTDAAATTQAGENSRAAAKAVTDAAKAQAKTAAGNRAKPAAIQSLSDTVNAALNDAQALKQASTKADRHRVASKMLRGSVPNKQQAAQGLQGVKKVPQLALTLALDMAYDGHISQNNAARLRSLGYRVSDIAGALNKAQWQRRQANRPKPRAPSGVGVFAPGQIGGLPR